MDVCKVNQTVNALPDPSPKTKEILPRISPPKQGRVDFSCFLFPFRPSLFVRSPFIRLRWWFLVFLWLRSQGSLTLSVVVILFRIPRSPLLAMGNLSFLKEIESREMSLRRLHLVKHVPVSPVTMRNHKHKRWAIIRDQLLCGEEMIIIRSGPDKWKECAATASPNVDFLYRLL